MELSDCTGYFADTAVTLPGETDVLFMATLDSFAEQLRDGLQVERRMLSLDPEQQFTLPLDGVVSFAGRNWALGLAMPDTFSGSVVRESYVAHLVDTAIQIGSAADWLAQAPRATSFGGVVWDKTERQSGNSEQTFSLVTVYAGSGLGILQGEFLRAAGRLYRVDNTYVTSSGLGAFEACETPADALQTIQWTSAASFDKVAGKLLPADPIALPALVQPWYQNSRMVTQAQIQPKDGDLVARVAQSAAATLKAGDGMQVEGVDFKVVAARPMVDTTWWVHLTT